MENHNILSFIIKNENATSDMLHALLAYKPFREVIIRVFTNNKHGADDIGWDDIDTQTSVGDAIPDLALLGEKVNILVEVKTTSWRGLTDNQPESYLKWLIENSNADQKYFVALVPPLYYHLEELNHRIASFKSQNNFHGINIVVVSWSEILRVISENDLQLLNQYIRDFSDLLSSWYETPITRMTFEEAQLIYDHNFLAAITNLIKITEGVISGLEQKGYEVSKSFNKRWWEGEYGGYVQYKEHDILWFGIWQKYWAKHNSPLCYGVHEGKWDSRVCQAFQGKYPSSILFPPGDTTPYRIKDIGKEILLSDDPVSKILNILEECLPELCDQIT